MYILKITSAVNALLKVNYRLLIFHTTVGFFTFAGTLK